MDTNLTQIVYKTSAKCSFEVRAIMLAMWHASACECKHNYIGVAIHNSFRTMWVSVISTDKISDCWIRNLGFNHRLRQKLIGVLVWW